MGIDSQRHFNVRPKTLLKDNDILILEKPNGVPIEGTKAQPGIIPLLKQSQRYSYCKSIIPLDVNLSGCALLSLNQTSTELLRNAYGSGLFRLNFIFISYGPVNGTELACDLPLMHTQIESRISHQKGKKSYTEFKYIKTIGGLYQLWSAQINYYRPNQLFLHTEALGIPVLGSKTISASPPPLLSELKRTYYKGQEAPLYSYPCAHLENIHLGTALNLELNIPRPKALNTLIEKISKYLQ